LKPKYYSCFLPTAALVALVMAVRAAPPGNISWRVFFEDPAPARVKAVFLAGSYLWPAVLSFTAIILFQLQFRLSASGAGKQTVFSVCLLASLSTLLGFQRLSLTPNAAPAYALGMALGYLTISRLYGMRMRSVGRGISIPWIIWRGNRQAVHEMDQLAAQVRQARAQEASRQR